MAKCHYAIVNNISASLAAHQSHVILAYSHTHTHTQTHFCQVIYPNCSVNRTGVNEGEATKKKNQQQFTKLSKTTEENEQNSKT